MPGPERTLRYTVPLATVARIEAAVSGGAAAEVTGGGVSVAGFEKPSRIGTLLTPKISSAAEFAQPVVPSRVAP